MLNIRSVVEGASLYRHSLKHAGPGQNQPGGVAVSGAAISQTITFAANGALSQNILFTLTDDSVADEPDEVYFLDLSNPSPQVALGDAAEITILDNDDNGNSAHECLIYQQNSHRYQPSSLQPPRSDLPRRLTRLVRAMRAYKS